MRWTCLALAMLMPLAAQATPPRVVTMTDRLVGQNNEGLFVERVVEDNLGYHFSALTDIFLVMIPYDGSAERLMPMRTVLGDFNRAHEEGLTVALEELHAGPTDLHSGLRDAGAFPLSEGDEQRDIVVRQVGPDVVEVDIGYGDPRSWHIPPKAASEAAWARTRASLPVARPFGVSEEEAEFYATDCRVEAVRGIWRAEGQWLPHAAVICEEDSQTQFSRFWLRLDPAP